jgi:hypothetical protein
VAWHVTSAVRDGITLATAAGQEETVAKDKIQSGILGDINPRPGTEEHVKSGKMRRDESYEAMVGGSQHDRTEHARPRDITERMTGRLGNRPE